MPIIYEKLLNYPIPEMRQHLRWQDVAMYISLSGSARTLWMNSSSIFSMNRA